LTPNDILRSIRYILNVNDQEMATIANLAGANIDAKLIDQFLKLEDDPLFKKCPDVVFSQFLNGLIYHKRGKDESRPALVPENTVSNNLVLKKLRIAFNLKDDEMIQTLKKAGQDITKSQLSALFRSSSHVNFCECGDQFLRCLLKGLAPKTSAPKK